MKIILDTEKKTITVPWNYTEKLAELNKMIETYGGEGAEKQTFTGYIDNIWKEAIANSDSQIRTGKKVTPKKESKKAQKKPNQE